MTLPPLQPDGTLPPGQHQVTDINDVFATFPARNAKRQVLNSALAQFIDVVRRQHLGTIVVIDGSYVSGKDEPDDIDLALLSTGASETATLQQLSLEGVDLAVLDVFVETAPLGLEGWVRFFIADRIGQLRGVVILTI